MPKVFLFLSREVVMIKFLKISNYEGFQVINLGLKDTTIICFM